MKPLIPIDRAVLCANCDRISDSLESRTNCIGCGSAAIALVEKLLAGPHGPPPFARSIFDNLDELVTRTLAECEEGRN
jgi:hypothetical protein